MASAGAVNAWSTARISARRTWSRSAAAPRRAMLVAWASSSGGNSRWPTLMPIPTSATPAVRSTRTPAILRPSTTTSFGHLMPAALPGMNERTASAAATAERMASDSGESSGSANVTATPASRVSSHARPSRPRPAVWRSAVTSVPGATPAARAWSWVLAVSRRTTASRSVLQPASADSMASGHASGGAGSACAGFMRLARERRRCRAPRRGTARNA